MGTLITGIIKRVVERKVSCTSARIFGTASILSPHYGMAGVGIEGRATDWLLGPWWPCHDQLKTVTQRWHGVCGAIGRIFGAIGSLLLHRCNYISRLSVSLCLWVCVCVCVCDVRVSIYLCTRQKGASVGVERGGSLQEFMLWMGVIFQCKDQL